MILEQAEIEQQSNRKMEGEDMQEETEKMKNLIDDEDEKVAEEAEREVEIETTLEEPEEREMEMEATPEKKPEEKEESSAPEE